MATQLTFKTHVLETVEHAGKSWLTAATLAVALEYSRGDKVTQIYNRNVDEFTPCMSINLNLRFNGLNNSLREKAVRVFSLRGAHLIEALQIQADMIVTVLNIRKAFRERSSEAAETA